MVWQLLKKLNTEVPYDPAILFLGICPKELKRYLYGNVHFSFIHNSWKVEITKVFINKWKDKHTVIYAYNGMLCTLKKEWSSDTCNNIDEPWKNTESNKKDKYCIIQFTWNMQNSQIPKKQTRGYQKMGDRRMENYSVWVGGSFGRRDGDCTKL